MGRIAATSKTNHATWPIRGHQTAAGPWTAGESPSFLELLAWELETSPDDLLARRARPFVPPLEAEARTVVSEPQAFHSRLMPPGWGVGTSIKTLSPGSLFTLAG